MAINVWVHHSPQKQNRKKVFKDFSCGYNARDEEIGYSLFALFVITVVIALFKSNQIKCQENKTSKNKM